MKIITNNPVIYTTVRVAEQDNFIPFDGKEDLDNFIADDGNEYFYSFDDDTYYNARGEKVFGVIKKIGGGIVKGGKAIGRGVVKGIKAIGRVLKNIKAKRAVRSKNKIKGVRKLVKKPKGKKLVHLKKQKRQPSTNSNSSTPSTTTTTTDTFLKPLDPITPQQAQSLKPQEIVEVNGQKYSAQGIPEGKAITTVQDPETGEQMVGFEFMPNEVVATTSADGNIDYFAQDDQKPMSTTTKVLLITGGVLVLGLIGFVIYKTTKK
jgi:hypothetical protein